MRRRHDASRSGLVVLVSAKEDLPMVGPTTSSAIPKVERAYLGQ